MNLARKVQNLGKFYVHWAYGKFSHVGLALPAISFTV
jgi:hypothetical protein